MTPPPRKVTVIIPVWNSTAWLRGCLEALLEQDYKDFSVLLVDDGSTDGSSVEASKYVRGADVLRLESNCGFAAATNAGIRQSRSPYVALLNVDTRAQPEWLGQLVHRLDSSSQDVGAVASQMLMMQSADLVDDAGNTLSWYGAAGKRGREQSADLFDSPSEVFSVCAGAALYRREFFTDVGPFDERFVSYLEDIDIGLRGRLLGWRYLYEPRAKVLHQGHGSDLTRARYVRMMTRNRLLLLLGNIPAPLLIQHAHRIFFGQFYFFFAYRHPLASVGGYLDAIRHLPSTLERRRQLAARSRLAVSEIDALLTRQPPEPSLVQLARQWTRSRLSIKRPAG